MEKVKWKYEWNSQHNRRTNGTLLFGEAFLLSCAVLLTLIAIVRNSAVFWVFTFVVSFVIMIYTFMFEVMRDGTKINDKLDKLLQNMVARPLKAVKGVLVHYLDDDGHYLCNKACGVTDGKYSTYASEVTCLNCMRKLQDES